MDLPPLHLRVLRCVDAAMLPGEVLSLAPPGGTVGRSPDAALPLPSATVSRRHAHLRGDGGAWQLEVLTASNGVFLDGLPVPLGGATVLRPGHQLQLGGVLLEVVAAREEATHPVLTPLVGADPVVLHARWDADRCTVRCVGRHLPLEPQPARALAVLMASAGETVHHWDLLDRLGRGASLERTMSKVRQGLRAAMAEGVLPRAVVEAGVAAHDATPPDGLSDADLLRRFISSHRSHGYRLCLAPDQVRIEQV